MDYILPKHKKVLDVTIEQYKKNSLVEKSDK